ncbi:MAG: MurR/RpiR family transcriptional regulator [Roseibium sp.]|uniref:MurR/RpiR family transcriptional regulator n=1 Tax=Roseibium sp. TaxID=1936156 RepID=UPI002606322E|nr:MurR/RpiR family transcriptional regulator [Roseibium sp.]MCV0428338.1 MurR/RpiR family transcriptional regulator [Roseibium sp.]
MNLTQTLRNALPDLPKKLAIAARYAMDHPDRMALDSMRGTAAAVGVTSTTMLRLARQLGFDSYEDFRAGFQNELLQGGFGARAGALLQGVSEGGEETNADKILLAAEENIRLVRAGLTPEDLDRLADLMRRAPNVFLVGSGSLFWLASMMKNTGSLVLSNLRLVGAEYAVAAEPMGVLQEDDIVICFGLNPIAQRTVEAMKYARRHGAFTVAITDRPSSPIAEDADFTLCADAQSPHYYPSVVAMVALVEVLLASIVMDGDGSEIARVEEFERLRKRSSAYLEY